MMEQKLEQVSRYNFWQKVPNLGFSRSTYLHWLNDLAHSSLVKVLVGQRRVGKSYILRQHIQHLINSGVPANNTLYINTEFPEYDFLKDDKALLQFIESYKKHFNIEGSYYLFMDEVQQIQNWEKVVNALSQDFTQKVHICITGSNSNLLSGELSTLLSGRYVERTVFPFTYQEYTSYLGLMPSRISYLKYLRTGGLPELFHLPNEETKRYYLSALRDTIVLRDIVQRYQIKDASLLNEIFNYLANNVSVLTNVTNLVNFWNNKKRKTNYETVANYLDYLLQTYLVHRCERFDIKGKDLLGAQYKYYLNDLSFINYLFSGNHQGMGALLENLVFMELKNAGYAVFVGHLRDKEVDFVARKSGQTIYVQSSFQLDRAETLEREISALLSVKDNYEKCIVTADESMLGQREGIHIIPAWEMQDWLGARSV
jgi:uncharacterized protein